MAKLTVYCILFTFTMIVVVAVLLAAGVEAEGLHGMHRRFTRIVKKGGCKAIRCGYNDPDSDCTQLLGCGECNESRGFCRYDPDHPIPCGEQVCGPDYPPTEEYDCNSFEGCGDCNEDEGICTYKYEPETEAESEAVALTELFLDHREQWDCLTFPCGPIPPEVLPNPLPPDFDPKYDYCPDLSGCGACDPVTRKCTLR